MTPNSVAAADTKILLTTWMCPACFKRILTQRNNPHTPVLIKLPVITGTHEHRQRRGMISTAAVEVEGNGQ